MINAVDLAGVDADPGRRAGKDVHAEQQLGIVKELTAQKRNRLFSYAGYIEIMNRGTQLPGE